MKTPRGREEERRHATPRDMAWEVFTHAHDVSRRSVPVLEAPVTSASVVIGDDVMIYNDVVILPGVTIGDGAVVAIRAVVTRDVQSGAVVAGVPARVVGRRS